MYWKLTFVIIIRFLTAAAEGKRRQDLNSDVVWQKVCIGMNFRSGEPSPFEVGVQILRSIYMAVEEVMGYPINRNENKLPLRMATEDHDHSSTRPDPTILDKTRQKKTCVGYEATLPIPRDVYNKILASISAKKKHEEAFGNWKINKEMLHDNNEASYSDKKPEQDAGDDAWKEQQESAFGKWKINKEMLHDNNVASYSDKKPEKDAGDDAWKEQQESPFGKWKINKKKLRDNTEASYSDKNPEQDAGDVGPAKEYNEAAAPRDLSEPYATINGYSVDMDAVTKYIMDLVDNPRRTFARWVELENSMYKSELMDYPPDHLKNRLLRLLAIKEAMEKRSRRYHE